MHDFYVQGAKHEIKNIRDAYVLEVHKANKLGRVMHPPTKVLSLQSLDFQPQISFRGMLWK